ncbi:unnamed protein product [Ectocarpus sp. 12 AP-2014]
MATTWSVSVSSREEDGYGDASDRLLAARARANDLEAPSPSRRNQATATTGTHATTTATPTPATTTTPAPKARGCSRKTAWVSALGCLALGFLGASYVGRCPGGYLNCDYEIDLPEGVNRATVPVPRDGRRSWMRQHAALKGQASEEGPTTRVLVLGDSITEELLGTRGGKIRPDWGSPAVWMRYYADLGSINLGVSGDQTQHLLWRLQNGELPDVLQPESILVAIGTNNLGKGMDAQDTVGGVKAVVKYVREQRPDALVSVMALFPRADPNDKKNPTPWPVIDEVNGLLEHMLRLKFGTQKVHFIDCNDRFLVEDRFGREVLNKEFILPDNLHLTGDGLDAWADCAEAAVHSGLGEG